MFIPLAILEAVINVQMEMNGTVQWLPFIRNVEGSS